MYPHNFFSSDYGETYDMLIHHNQHSQHPTKYEKQKLGNNMEGETKARQ